MKRLSKNILFALLAIVTSYSAYSAVQQGYAKTPGRLGENGVLQPGKRLPNVVVSGKGLTRVISGSDGSFSLSFRGEGFSLSEVSKPGYALVDREQLRQYSYSKDNLVLVLEDIKVQEQERLSIERKIRRTMRRTLAEKEEEIERLREENKITQSQLDSLYRRLYADEENNQRLVAEMAEEYAKTDFDSYDDFRRKVAGYIISGDLVRADSLLNTKGSVEERMAEIQRMRTVNAERGEEIRRQQEDLENSMNLERHKTEDLASDFLNRYTLCYLRHDADSAAYWLKLRAELDTANIVWTIQAGSFLHEYIGDSSKAFEYYRRVLRLAGESGKKSLESVCFNKIGLLLEDQGKFKEALECHNRALDIVLGLYGENSEQIIACYNNIANCYSDMGKNREALDLQFKILEMRLSLYGEQKSEVATTYNNIGMTYLNLGDYQKALEYTSKALELNILIGYEDSPDIVLGYGNVGTVYSRMGNYEKAISYFSKSLEKGKKIFSERHPVNVSLYVYIADIYYEQKKFSEALEYYQKVVDNLDYISNFNSIAHIYNRIGFSYLFQGDSQRASDAFEKEVENRIAVLKDEYHPDLMIAYLSLGYAGYNSGRYEESLNAYKKAVEISKKQDGEKSASLAKTYYNIGMVCGKLGMPIDAVEYCYKAYRIYEDTGEDDKNSFVLLKIFEEYCKCKDKSDVRLSTIASLIECSVFYIEVKEGETEAAKQGLKGEYLLLEYGDWNIASGKNILEAASACQGKPKDIAVMNGGEIERYHFQGKIGIQFNAKNIGREEKERIIREYCNWKQQE